LPIYGQRWEFYLARNWDENESFRKEVMMMSNYIWLYMQIK